MNDKENVAYVHSKILFGSKEYDILPFAENAKTRRH
jgi:hypothetical protein